MHLGLLRLLIRTYNAQIVARGSAMYCKVQKSANGGKNMHRYSDVKVVLASELIFFLSINISDSVC